MMDMKNYSERERERELLRMANLTVAEIPPLSRNKPSINLQ